ncbi:MAG: DNA repair protein RadA [Actinomycetaceae bacterium]|nr:DNA repair protein RadA [Actinomycetaceae bacterium]MDY6082673.1 DNA repair protein RadA [Actinomycetaceae bacterium]
MAKKPVTTYRCSHCGWTTTKWVGRCPQCGEWNTLEEVAQPLVSPAQSGGRGVRAPHAPARPITDVPSTASEKSSTGVAELDRVLGGGLVPGAVILLAGEPGVGKSTLLLDVAAHTASAGGKPVLYVSGEESSSQVRLRAERIGAMDPNLYLASESDVDEIIAQAAQLTPSLLVVDSVQTIQDPDTDGAMGNVAQIRAVTARLVALAKAQSMPTLVVGHVTKDGTIAGPRVLEHLVDVVCQFEGDQHSELRMVRAVKNRYGPTDEVGCFVLTEDGIVGLPDPSGLFLSSRERHVPGACVTIALEGRRPLPVEIEGLVVPTGGPPRRTTSGVDSPRVAMAVAVLQSRLGFQLDRRDVFVSTVGGARAAEPATDAAICLALASAQMDLPIAGGVAACGEVSLTGELRPVQGVSQRIAEAERLGFTRMVIPRQKTHRGKARTHTAIDVVECSDLQDAIEAVLPLHAS